MGKKTALQEVKERMSELLERRAEDLQTIQLKKEEANSQKAAAEQDLKTATECMNLTAYETAKEAKHRAQTAIDMYNARYNQLKQMEIISEEESDKIVDSLLSYEADLEEEFKANITPRLQELATILEAYRGNVNDTEDTIRAWSGNVHANYNTRGLSSFRDPVTGERTNRSPDPVPVHKVPYLGCAEAEILGKLLKSFKIVND